MPLLFTRKANIKNIFENRKLFMNLSFVKASPWLHSMVIMLFVMLVLQVLRT